MSQDILWVFLLSTLSSQNDTNLATNTNILLLLLLGLTNSNNNFGNNFNSLFFKTLNSRLGCNRHNGSQRYRQK